MSKNCLKRHLAKMLLAGHSQYNNLIITYINVKKTFNNKIDVLTISVVNWK